MQKLPGSKSYAQGKLDQSAKELNVIKSPSLMNQQSSQMLMGMNGTYDPFYQDDDLEITEFTREAPVSPSMSLANDMRTDSHKLQLMKASFFVDDDCESRSLNSDFAEDRDSPDQTVPSNKTILGHRFLLPSSRSVASDSLSGYADSQDKDQNMEVDDKRADILPSKILKAVGPKSMPLIVRPKVTQFNLSGLAIPMKVEFSIQIYFMYFTIHFTYSRTQFSTK